MNSHIVYINHIFEDFAIFPFFQDHKYSATYINDAKSICFGFKIYKTLQLLHYKT